MKKNALKNCDFVKTILMLMVILGHSCAFWSGNWFTRNPAVGSDSLNIFYQLLRAFHIYAFVLVSGYIFCFKVLSGGYNEYIPFLKNKAKRLLIPYVFVMIVWVVPLTSLFFGFDLRQLFITYILCIDPSQLWFLWMLFGVFAVIWPIRKLMINRPVIGWFIACIFYVIGKVGNNILPNVFCVWNTCEYILFFYIGIRIRTKEEKGSRIYSESIPFYVWAALFIIIFIVNQYVNIQYTEYNMAGVYTKLIRTGCQFFLHFVGAVAAWATLQKLAEISTPQNNRLFRTLSSYTMPMYLFHQQIIYFTIWWLNGVVDPWINALVNFVVALVISFLISTLLMKWKPTRLLIGEK